MNIFLKLYSLSNPRFKYFQQKKEQPILSQRDNKTPNSTLKNRNPQTMMSSLNVIFFFQLYIYRVLKVFPGIQLTQNGNKI